MARSRCQWDGPYAGPAVEAVYRLDRQLHVHQRAVLLGAVDVGVLVREELASNSPRPQVVESNAMDKDHLVLCNRVLSTLRCLKLDWTERVIARSVQTEIQRNGRVRFWGFVPEFGMYFRVVTLSDRETVHNAFPDRDFRPRLQGR